MSSSDTETRQRDICCCGAGSWTKVIAWLQIVPSGFGYIVCVILFVISQIWSVQGPFWFPILVFYLYMEVLMGIILLKGAKERISKNLYIWRVYAIIFLCIRMVLIAFLSAITGKISHVHQRYMFNVFVYEEVTRIVINIFFIWVVWVFQKEIEQNQTNTVNGITHTA